MNLLYILIILELHQAPDRKDVLPWLILSLDKLDQSWELSQKEPATPAATCWLTVWEHHTQLCLVGCWAVTQPLECIALILVPWQTSQGTRSVG